MTMAVPTATVEEVWRLRSAWAATSRSGKKRQDSARYWSLLLSVLGALLSAVATVSDLVGLAVIQPWVATLAAVLVATAAYLGKELVTQDRETEWARARILGEALKRECWKCLMSVPPYHEADAGEQLRRRAAEYSSNVGLDREPIPPEQAESLVPIATSDQDYVANRAQDQMAWYERRAGEHRRHLVVLKRRSFSLGLFGVALGVIGTREGFVPALALVPVVTTAGAAVVAWIQAVRLAPMVDVYQQAASQLRLRLAAWEDGAATRATLPDLERARATAGLVDACETIMARENDSWRAEWLSEEKIAAALDAIQTNTGAKMSPGDVADE